MKSTLIIGIACTVLLGCRTMDYSDNVAAELHDVKVQLSQLHDGMSRQEVETILKPIPYLHLDMKISGILLNDYELRPGIWVQLDFGGSNSDLLMLPSELDELELTVHLDSKGKETRRHKNIPLAQIK